MAEMTENPTRRAFLQPGLCSLFDGLAQRTVDARLPARTAGSEVVDDFRRQAQRRQLFCRSLLRSALAVPDNLAVANQVSSDEEGAGRLDIVWVVGAVSGSYGIRSPSLNASTRSQSVLLCVFFIAEDGLNVSSAVEHLNYRDRML
jgi:hypothetical protein